MAGNHESEADDEMLRAFLRAQRESVVAIVDGLDEEAWHRSVVPTGWTPAGLLEHLGGDQCAQSESVLATTPLSAPPLGKHGRYEPPNVRWVVLHMIEETARHVGHLDIARELLDGTTRLGGR